MEAARPAKRGMMELGMANSSPMQAAMLARPKAKLLHTASVLLGADLAAAAVCDAEAALWHLDD